MSTTTDTTTQELACVHCGAEGDFWAWYDAPERQTIEIDGVGEDGRVRYDYTGCTKHGEDVGGDTSYMCGACGSFNESLEALVGLPEVPHVSTLAALFAEGPELDDDDFSELCDIVIEEVARRRGNDVEIIDTVRTTP